MQAHRAAYLIFIGPIPDGLEIDHECHVPEFCDLGDECPHRSCTNPAHLVATTPHANTMRSNSPSARHAAATHCPSGHPYEGDNIYIRPDGRGKDCMECRRRQNRRTVQRRRREAASRAKTRIGA